VLSLLKQRQHPLTTKKTQVIEKFPFLFDCQSFAVAAMALALTIETKHTKGMINKRQKRWR